MKWNELADRSIIECQNENTTFGSLWQLLLFQIYILFHRKIELHEAFQTHSFNGVLLWNYEFLTFSDKMSQKKKQLEKISCLRFFYCIFDDFTWNNLLTKFDRLTFPLEACHVEFKERLKSIRLKQQQQKQN